MYHRIVIAGGAGFIGSNLCHRLIAEGNQIICIDNLSTGSITNIQDLFTNANFQFIRQDIIDPIQISGSVDQIYNFACPASPIHYQADPIHTIKTNVLGCLNLLELAKEKKASILQSSTSEIYGDPLVHPQIENYWGNVHTTGIRSCYDEGKRISETLFTDFGRQYHVRTKIARIFNTYGPHMQTDDGRVISNFIVQALAGKPVTIYGTGQQTRSFCFITDQLNGLIKLMNSDIAKPVNIGNPAEYTIGDIARLIIQLTNSSSEIITLPLPEDDPHRRKPDITLAQNLLHWSPTIDLISGLKETISYFAAI